MNERNGERDKENEGEWIRGGNEEQGARKRKREGNMREKKRGKERERKTERLVMFHYKYHRG